MENLCEVTAALEGKDPFPHRGRAVGHPTSVSIISFEPHISPVFLPFTHWGSWRQVIGSESQGSHMDPGPPEVSTPAVDAVDAGTRNSSGRKSRGGGWALDLCYLEASSQGDSKKSKISLGDVCISQGKGRT